MAPSVSTTPSPTGSFVGIIITIAGTGASSYSGDNGAATSAAMYRPQAVAIDSSGSYAVTLLCSA